MATTSTPPGTGEPPAPQAPPPATGSGFFGWLRSLGVPRLPGWIGGVAAGIAARLNIDPIIVRGVLVVFALFGAPAFLLYGAAWLLLPDASGRIHLERLFAGVWDRALVGIALFLLVGLFPLAFGGPSIVGGVWNSFDGDWGLPWVVNPLGFNVLPFLWALVFIGGVVALIVWLANRSSRTERETPPDVAFARYEAAAQADASAASAAAASAANATDASAAPPAPPTGAPVPPPYGAAAPSGAAPSGAAPSGAAPAQSDGTAEPVDEYADWRRRHEAWRVEHDAWRQSQAEANRAAKAQLAAENAARAAAFQAQAQHERHIRRATRPRTSFAYVVAALGAAMLAGAIASLIALQTDASDVAVAIGLAAATATTALSMVLAGALRRRSGFLAFVTIVLLLITMLAATAPRAPRFIIGSTSGGVSSSTLMQPAGNTHLTVDASLAGNGEPVETEVFQAAGRVEIEVRDGARVQVKVECASCFVGWDRVAADGETTDVEGVQLDAARNDSDQAEWIWDETIGEGLEPGETDAIITVHAFATDVRITEFTTER
ncbi:PspC domain-containing protein [Agromyces aerolatus]|uniref:PspC domain-containing protein n=1 Tax=Agromyces sp. LY-1074 TaxID=3074080 RepID=UPI002863CC60|nr:MULTISPECIES: PspC domain-containing protein [unclassified Agromyces]MDR5701260.1 PspC domain-containing protein [Agromyces sp. LY-1074]MDR5706864.1 PspC domain-containing protein [Agromyces sp. LY-1358]